MEFLSLRPKLESDLLRTFIAVAEAESFTTAANMIGLTQSAVSAQMKRLEEAVGHRLFCRKAYGMVLTNEGRSLETHAKRVVALIDASANVVSNSALEGIIRLGVPEEYGSGLLTEALAEFSRNEPKVEILVRCVSSAAQLKALDADELDLAVVFEPEGRTKGAKLSEEPTVWVANNEHQLHKRSPVPVAVYSNSEWSRNLALRSLEMAEISYRVTYISDTLGGFLLALKSGLAIVPLSRSGIPPGYQDLSNAGFPEIDRWQVVLHRNPRVRTKELDAMINALQSAFRRHIG